VIDLPLTPLSKNLERGKDLLTPCVPLSKIREGEEIYSPPVPLSKI